VFVAAPPGAGSSAEGVVVAVVNQADGRSALLLLDGGTHAEVARAVLPHGVTNGFHGAWLPA
jgi:carotenoid cleavage dioxygenase-like enzyme